MITRGAASLRLLSFCKTRKPLCIGIIMSTTTSCGASRSARASPALPAPNGWRMPAEWEPHEATWIAWPHHRADWPGKFAAIPWVYAEIVRQLSPAERVHILVNDAQTEKSARRILDRAGVDLKQVRFFRFATDRVWTRDYGPIFLVGPAGKVAMTDWGFTGWAKY